MLPQNFFKNFKTNFNVIIGNPPWVSLTGKHKSLDLPEEELEYLLKKYQSNTSMPNLYEMFIWKSLSLMEKGGFFSFIVPDRLCTNKQFINLRKYILENFSIKELWFRVPFPKITADTVIFIIEATKKTNNIVKIIDFPTKKTETINQNVFKNTPDNLFFYIKKDFYDLFTRIKSNKNTLDLSKIVLTTSGCGAKSTEITNKKIDHRQMPILKGESIIKYGTRYKFWFEFISNKLSGRTKDKGKLGKKMKVLLRKTGSDLIATYDEVGTFPEQSLYFLYTEKDNQKDLLLVLLAIINSTLMNCYYRNFAVTNRDSTPQLKNMDLDKFPIILPKNKEILIKHVNKIISLTKRVIKIGNQMNEEREEIEGEIEKINIKIDELIYDVYNLTETEKNLVRNFKNL